MLKPFTSCVMPKGWGYGGAVKPGGRVIIQGNYTYLYGGRGNGAEKTYAFYVVENGKVTNACAWANEGEFSPIKGPGLRKCIQMIEDYRMKR